MRKIAIFIFSAMHKNAECINVLVLTPNFFLFWTERRHSSMIANRLFQGILTSYVVSFVVSFVSCESSCVMGRGIVGQVEK